MADQSPPPWTKMMNQPVVLFYPHQPFTNHATSNESWPTVAWSTFGDKLGCGLHIVLIFCEEYPATPRKISHTSNTTIDFPCFLSCFKGNFCGVATATYQQLDGMIDHPRKVQCFWWPWSLGKGLRVKAGEWMVSTANRMFDIANPSVLRGQG